MVDKKEDMKKESVAPKITKKAVPRKTARAVKKDEPKVIKTKVTGKKVEPRFPAKELAEKQGIRSFEFFVIKREANIADNTVLTAAEMQELYKKIIKR